MKQNEVFRRFPDQQACIDHVEAIRFNNNAYCPLCGSVEIIRRMKENNLVGRWNCHDCKSSFNIHSGTVMQGTHIPIQKWFLGIALMVNAKRSLSSYQLARDLEMNQKAALYMRQRIRTAVASNQAPMLDGEVAADETYVCGKPRKPNRRLDMPKKPGPKSDGSSKNTPVIGAVQRDGNVIAQVARDL